VFAEVIYLFLDFLFRASCDRSVAFSATDAAGFAPVTPDSSWAYSYVQQVNMRPFTKAIATMYLSPAGLTI
jgi:hypothetical protein